MIKVLIVEDDPMVAELNKRYLGKIEGFELRASVRTADEAIDILEYEDIHLVLLDIFMPGMDGLELLSQIRKKGKGIDVILVTAACDKKTIETAMRYGVVDYLIKPFEFERFWAAMASYRKLKNDMKEKSTFDQKQLDQILQNKTQTHLPSDIPKGLDRNTLRLVWSQIEKMENAEFSTEVLAASIGISRVSTRKYLEFLNHVGVLQQEINYGSIGRPVNKYRCNDQGSQIIKSYLL